MLCVAVGAWWGGFFVYLWAGFVFGNACIAGCGLVRVGAGVVVVIGWLCCGGWRVRCLG